MYAATGKRHLCENVERQRKEKGVKKQLGCTWIEVNDEVHMFVADNQDHPEMIEIHAKLQRLSGLMHDAQGMYLVQNLCWMMWKKKKRYFLCVTIMRNWLLPLGSSTQLLVLLSE
jgi:hypothetical protein